MRMIIEVKSGFYLSVSNECWRCFCRTFPKCPYADRCIYIHPNCKYDQTCSRLNCPYTHAGKKGSSQGPAPQAPPKHHKPPPTHYSSTGTHKSISVPCRFGPKCTNVRCPYQHPKVHFFFPSFLTQIYLKSEFSLKMLIFDKKMQVFCDWWKQKQISQVRSL